SDLTSSHNSAFLFGIRNRAAGCPHSAEGSPSSLSAWGKPGSLLRLLFDSSMNKSPVGRQGFTAVRGERKGGGFFGLGFGHALAAAAGEGGQREEHHGQPQVGETTPVPLAASRSPDPAGLCGGIHGLAPFPQRTCVMRMPRRKWFGRDERPIY